MNYPITIEQITEVFEETNGCKVPDNKHRLIADFVDLLNSAYRAGVSAGESNFKGAA